MGFREAVSHVFKNYANFNGRARRSEYWYFFLFNWLVGIVATVLLIAISGVGLVGIGYSRAYAAGGALSAAGIIGFLYSVYCLAIILPTIAVTCRRLHDVGKSGAYILIGFIPVVGWIFLLIWMLQDSDPGNNQYGPNPKSSYGSAWSDSASGKNVTVAIEPPPMARQAAPQVQGRTLYLQGIAGCYSGQRIPINGQILIGRGPDCSLQFPQDTNGVSRKHCILRLNGNQLLIQDLGSSFGTYINGNVRLNANQAASLRPGDRIFIGSNGQGFVVVG